MGTDTKKCSICGKELPLTDYYTYASGNPRNTCKNCYRERNVRNKQLRAIRRRGPRGPYKPKLNDDESDLIPNKLISPLHIPIPTLEVGKTYEIEDLGRPWWEAGVSGGDGNAKPVTYRGPCVGRWGRNWGIATATGVRCFTQAQLVGLAIKEVA